MTHGGKRTGAGRKAGSITKRSRLMADAALTEGETPADYMLRVMRDPTVEHDRRDKMAVASAPYVHPKLAAVEHTGKDGGPIATIDVTDQEAARRIAFTLAKATQPTQH